ncbi:MAG: zf-TFIIB domain-containing protein [Gemmatimonadales bacterium]
MSDSLHCPGCGAPASADAAKCDYCGAPLATVTCPQCFAPMFVGSKFCARCGAAAARAVVENSTPQDCPRCGATLQALQLGATTAHECAACGGLWLDPESLQKLCDAREAHAGVVSALGARPPASAPSQDTVRYIHCPHCGKLMNRVNFAHTSGVIMDVCKVDGVWLDRGELERVVTFVERGGLAAAREKERAQLDDERRRVEMARAGSATTFMGYRDVTIGVTTPGASSRAPVEQLLLDALNMFIRH